MSAGPVDVHRFPDDHPLRSILVGSQEPTIDTFLQAHATWWKRFGHNGAVYALQAQYRSELDTLRDAWNRLEEPVTLPLDSSLDAQRSHARSQAW
jgi:hypothetical protein